MGALFITIIWKRKTSAESGVRRSFNEICDFGVPFLDTVGNWTQRSYKSFTT